MLSLISAAVSPSSTSAPFAVAQCITVALAGVLVTAAVAKLRDRRTTANAFRGLRLPAPPTLAIAVPLVEIGAAGLLLAWARVGGIVAAALVVGFSFVLVRARRFGEVRCGCFGAADSAAVTWVTFVRNALLAVGAALVAIAGPARPTSAGVWIATVTGATTFVLIGAVLLAVFDMARTVGTVFGQPAINRDFS